MNPVRRLAGEWLMYPGNRTRRAAFLPPRLLGMNVLRRLFFDHRYFFQESYVSVEGTLRALSGSDFCILSVQMFLLLLYISSRIFHHESLCNKNKLSVAGLALCTGPTFFCGAVSSLSSCALPSPSPD